jgi:acyl-CoA thioesterase YciA
LNIEVRKYSLYSGDETVVCTTNTTFVRIDDDGSPTPIGETIKQKHELLQKLKYPDLAAVEN